MTDNDKGLDIKVELPDGTAATIIDFHVQANTAVVELADGSVVTMPMQVLELLEMPD